MIGVVWNVVLMMMNYRCRYRYKLLLNTGATLERVSRVKTGRRKLRIPLTGKLLLKNN